MTLNAKDILGKDKSPRAPIDWPEVKSEILSRLNLRQQYEELGLRFVSSKIDSMGRMQCHAIDREDKNASAVVFVESGNYFDSATGKSLSFFDFALAYGKFDSWMVCMKHYANVAGVELSSHEIKKDKSGSIVTGFYEYRDENDLVRYVVKRYTTPTGGKKFQQFKPNREGKLESYPGVMNGVDPLPYQLPELLSAPDMDAPIWVFEGEKDVDTARAHKMLATTGHGGANNVDNTWPYFLHYLVGRQMLIVPDFDKAGWQAAYSIARKLGGTASRIRVVHLSDAYLHDDLTSWLGRGHTVDELYQLASDTPDFDPKEPDPVWRDRQLPPADPVPSPPVPDSNKLPPSSVNGDHVGPYAKLICMNTVKVKPVRWVWENRIPRGMLTMFAGESKVGKSFAMYDLLSRISRGAAYPDNPAQNFETGSSLVLIDEDDVDSTTALRLERAEADLSQITVFEDVIHGESEETFSLNDIGPLEQAIKEMKERSNLQVVWFDPVTSFIGDANENKNSEVRRAIRPLRRLAKKYDVAVVMITHLNKGGSDGKAFSRVLGAGAWTAVSRVNWLFALDPGDRDRRLMVEIGQNLVERQSGLAYSIQDSRAIWESEPVAMTADDLLFAEAEQTRSERGSARGPSPNQEQVEAWLTEVLSGNREIESAFLFEEALAKGFPKKAVYKAGVTVKAIKRRKGDGWAWSLPPVTGRPSNGVEATEAGPAASEEPW